MPLPNRARTILIVDDDPFDSSLIERSIRASAGDSDLVVIHESERAAPLFEALRPDLTLLDISMPVLDGFGVLERIRANAAHGEATVIMLSGSTSARDRERALAGGAQDYRVKPSSLAGYRALADELLHHLPQSHACSQAHS